MNNVNGVPQWKQRQRQNALAAKMIGYRPHVTGNLERLPSGAAYVRDAKGTLHRVTGNNLQEVTV